MFTNGVGLGVGVGVGVGPNVGVGVGTGVAVGVGVGTKTGTLLGPQQKFVFVIDSVISRLTVRPLQPVFDSKFMSLEGSIKCKSRKYQLRIKLISFIV